MKLLTSLISVKNAKDTQKTLEQHKRKHTSFHCYFEQYGGKCSHKNLIKYHLWKQNNNCHGVSKFMFILNKHEIDIMFSHGGSLNV